MAEASPASSTWTLNDGGAVASLCADGEAGETLARHLRELHGGGEEGGGSGALVPITSPSERALSVARGLARACVQALGDGWCVPVDLPIARQHVPEDCVEAALQSVGTILAEYPDRCVVLLAVGGSSTVGLAKAVKHLAPMHAGGLHIACVTTTFAGSECTNILGYMQGGQKRVLRDKALRPELRVYDASLFLTLPFGLSIASAWNAFAHAVGCLSSTANVSPVELLKAKEACTVLVRGFHTCARLGKTEHGGLPRESIGDLIYGAILCGSVMNECSMGIHHKLVHVVAGSLDLEHSSVHTALLPFTVHFNRDHKPSMISVLAQCGLPEDKDPAGALWDLQKQLGAPTSLQECGFRLESLESVVATVDAGSGTYENARPVDAAGVTELLLAAHQGRRPSVRNRLDLGASGGRCAATAEPVWLPRQEELAPLMPSFRMPLLGLGTAAHQNTEACRSVVAAAISYGIRLFDTAQNYGSEQALGQGVLDSGIDRECIFYSAKVDLNSHECPERRMRRQVMSTMKNLNTSYLDSVIFHWPVCLDRHDADHRAVRKVSWQALETLVLEGAVRHIGVSNFTVDLLDELLSFAKVRPTINQVEFSPLVFQRDLLTYCVEQRIQLVGYSPYGVCWMAAYQPELSQVDYGLTQLLQEEVVMRIADEIGRTPAQVLLRWCVQHGVVVIPKTASPERVLAAKDIFGFCLSGEQMALLSDLSVYPARGASASIEHHLKIIEGLPADHPSKLT